MNFAQEEEKEPIPMDGVQFTPTIAEPELITKGQESDDGEMYYVPSSTQSTPNIIGNASEIQEEQDQKEENVGQQTTIISTRRQKREKAKAAKVAESQNFAWVTRVNCSLKLSILFLRFWKIKKFCL